MTLDRDNRNNYVEFLLLVDTEKLNYYRNNIDGLCYYR